MPIEKLTADQIRDDLSEAIAENPEHEVHFGPIKDIVIDPVAAVNEAIAARTYEVSRMIALDDPDNLAVADVDRIIYNEGLTRNAGTQASVTLTFYANVVDPNGSDLYVPRGFPVGVKSTGTAAVTFVTTADAILPAASAASYYNATRRRYEVSVQAVSTTRGTAGRVGPNRVVRPLRALNGFAGVVNLTASVGGQRDAETNREVIERYLMAVRGRSIATATGLQFWALNQFPDVVDTRAVYGTDSLVTRSTVTGAVDLYVVGDQLATTTATFVYLGHSQRLVFPKQPVRSVTSVTSGAVTYVEGVDFDIVTDTSAQAGSVNGQDALVFRPLATATLPALGAAVNVTYSYNTLIETMQVAVDQPDNYVEGRSLLVKAGLRVNIYLSGTLAVKTGYVASTVLSTAVSKLTAYINELRLGAPVEGSDLQAVVRSVVGVDNFIITRLVRDALATGTADVALAGNEHAIIDTESLAITLV